MPSSIRVTVSAVVRQRRGGSRQMDHGDRDGRRDTREDRRYSFDERRADERLFSLFDPVPSSIVAADGGRPASDAG